jgi:hypothetical protein
MVRQGKGRKDPRVADRQASDRLADQIPRKIFVWQPPVKQLGVLAELREKIPSRNEESQMLFPSKATVLGHRTTNGS